MKKRFIVLTLLLSLSFIGKVNAGGYVNGSTSITLGNSASYSVGVTGDDALANIEVTLTCKGAGVNSSKSYTADPMGGSGKSYTSGSISIKPTSEGTLTCTASGRYTDLAHSGWLGISSSKTIKVSKPYVAPKDNRSGNNNLKSLSVEGYEISPKFDSSKKEYTLNLTYDITKIKIKAEKEHNKASISGDTGEKEVKVGDNNFSITVKAENGNTKTYKLKVIVDSKPIKVTIDGKEYTVIKKKEELPELKIEHEDKELNLEDQNVPAFRIESIKYTLIGLQDSEGNKYLCRFKAYKAEEKPTEYTLFNPINVSEMYVNIEDFPESKIPANYSKYEEVINGIKVTVYKLNKTSKYSLIYGTNILTGNSNIYRYDSNEKTIQIYEREEAKELEELIENGKKLVLILGGVILFLIILTTIGFSRKPKTKKVKEKKDLSDSDIKKIEKDTSKSNKKELKRQKKLEKKKLKKGEPEL